MDRFAKLEAFPRLFALEIIKDALMKDHISISGDFLWQWHRDLRGGREAEQLRLLLDILRNIELMEGPYEWRWMLDPMGVFNVAGLRKKVDAIYLPSQDQPTSWNNLLSQKVNIMAWKLLRNRLPTKFNLDARGIDLHSTLCSICKEVLEDVDHAFCGCMNAKNL
uniref:Reverse transcriptase zinc-binding domain-containing protein n=1 Tax=Tanacetum cinerariifolium TaxID=118510 RepID=A0A699GQ62_TANCI|nr:hypothetical protein [Tanacetum cinerariifolium]